MSTVPDSRKQTKQKVVHKLLRGGCYGTGGQAERQSDGQEERKEEASEPAEEMENGNRETVNTARRNTHTHTGGTSSVGTNSRTHTHTQQSPRRSVSFRHNKAPLLISEGSIKTELC